LPVSILTDSAASLPKDITTAATISVVPMWLTIGDSSVHDGDLGLEEVLARIDEGITTSAPTPGEFEVALEEAGIDDGALVLTIAGTMSSTVQSANVAAQSLDPDRVHVLDTGTAAGAEGLVVLAAADAAASGCSLPEVEAVARRVASRVHLIATIADLDRLAKSGRVPEAAAWAGRWLGLQPMFEFRDGRAHALRPARSRTKALDRILEMWTRSAPGRSPGTAIGSHVAALHTLSPDEAEGLLDRVQDATSVTTSFVGSFSPVMLSHTGPGLVGLSWWWDDRSGDRST
jgi:fatty acid kinase fatty acid binding subunit